MSRITLTKHILSQIKHFAHVTKVSSLLTQVVYKTNDDHVTVVAAGVTLHEALAAAEQLKKGAGSAKFLLSFEASVGLLYIIRFLSPLSERINIRVIDPFTIKPLDSKTITDNARATRGRIITVEDHYCEGESLKCVS